MHSPELTNADRRYLAGLPADMREYTEAMLANAEAGELIDQIVADHLGLTRAQAAELLVCFW